MAMFWAKAEERWEKAEERLAARVGELQDATIEFIVDRSLEKADALLSSKSPEAVNDHLEAKIEEKVLPPAHQVKRGQGAVVILMEKEGVGRTQA